MYATLNGVELRDPLAIARLCDEARLETGCWDLSKLDATVLDNPASQESAILEAIAGPLGELKARRGYASEDIVRIAPDIPGIHAALAKFEKEHHHTDDEVRVILAGAGIFGIVPNSGQPFELHVEAGDLIVLPAFIRHWFKVTDACRVTALRVFKENPAWEAIYEAPPVTTAAARG
jgi:1,2-dihydroxy-3-keto-5-methylthiopentene dioxygenase